jgi:hypothetical protein
VVASWVRVDQHPRSLFVDGRHTVTTHYRRRASATYRLKACITIPCPRFVDTRLEVLDDMVPTSWPAISHPTHPETLT